MKTHHIIMNLVSIIIIYHNPGVQDGQVGGEEAEFEPFWRSDHVLLGSQRGWQDDDYVSVDL